MPTKPATTRHKFSLALLALALLALAAMALLPGHSAA